MTATISPVAERLPGAPPRRSGGITWPQWVLLAMSCMVAIATTAVVAGDIDFPGRWALAVAFMVLVPGAPMAVLIGPIGRRDVWAAMVPALSLAVLTLASLISVYSVHEMRTGLIVYAATLLHGMLAVSCVFLPGSGWAGRGAQPLTSLSTLLPTLVMTAAAGALWYVASKDVDLDRAGATGMLGVAPPTYWAAVLLAAAHIAYLLTRDDLDHLSLFISAVVAIVLMYQFAAFTDGGAISGVGYIHTGIIDAIKQHGTPPPGMDARFTWPGFFTLALLTEKVAGLPDSTPFVVWYPALMSTLWVMPLLSLGRTLTQSLRSAWIGVFVFVMGNWVAQDYFSPQSLAMLWLIMVLSLLLLLVQHGAADGESEGKGILDVLRLRWTSLPAERSWRLQFAIVFLMTAMVPSHQLTPLYVNILLVVVAVVGLTPHRMLWVPVAALFAAWFCVGAETYWVGNFAAVTGGVGDVGTAVRSETFETATGGDPFYAQMQLVRIAWCALIGVVALVGLSMLRGPIGRALPAVMVVAPAGLVVVQSYGGESILRTFLYALPVLSALCGVALRRVALSRGGFAFMAAVFAVAAVVLTTTRGLNVSFERNPADTVRAGIWLSSRVPDRAVVYPGWGSSVLQTTRFHQTGQPGNCPKSMQPADCLMKTTPDYVFLSSTHEAQNFYMNRKPRNQIMGIEPVLTTQAGYRVIWKSEHVVILASPKAKDLEPEVPR